MKSPTRAANQSAGGSDRPAFEASTHTANDDRRFMALALELGRRGLGRTWPNPAVGAVVVQHRSGRPVIVGRGWTQPGGRPHAETQALACAGVHARGASLYVTLEPCSHYGQTPPCVDAVISAGIARVVSAIEDPNPEVAGRGHAQLRSAQIAVDIGEGADEAARAHAGHFRRMREGRPHVLLKLAVSADEKVGRPGRPPISITGEAARDRVHLLRAMNDAILIGAGTAIADDPQLTCRLPGMSARSPVRVILDTHLRLPVESQLVQTARDVPVWVIAGTDAGGQAEQTLRDCGVEILRTQTPDGGVDVFAALKLLATRGITRLMVEGGPTVATALVAADLIDEVALLRSRKVVGADGISALARLPLSALTQSPRLRPRAIETIGDDSIESFERT